MDSLCVQRRILSAAVLLFSPPEGQSGGAEGKKRLTCFQLIELPSWSGLLREGGKRMHRTGRQGGEVLKARRCPVSV